MSLACFSYLSISFWILLEKQKGNSMLLDRDTIIKESLKVGGRLLRAPPKVLPE